MWSWKRIASVALLIGGGVACTLVGQPAVGVALISSGAGLALGVNMPPVTPAKKKE